MIIQFKHEAAKMNFSPYMNNGNTAIILTDPVTNQHLSTLSTNTEDKLPNNVIAIKDRPEDAGVVDSLINQGIVEPTPIYKLEANRVSVGVFALTEKGETERAHQYDMNEYAKLMKQPTA